MTSFYDALRNAYKAYYCTVGRLEPEWWANLRRIVTPEGLNDLARNLTRTLCDINPDPADDLTPVYLGGQCEGVTYRLNGPFSCKRWRCQFNDYTSDFSTNENSDTVVGPVLSAGVRVVDVGGLCGTNRLECFITGANGIERVKVLNTSTASVGKQRFEDPQGGELIRIDGLPDECGEPDYDLPPPGNIETTINIDYGDTNQYNLTVPVIFAPVYVALDGSLNFNFNIPEIKLSGTVNLTNDFDITLDFSGDQGSGVTDDDPVPVPEEDEDEPEEPGSLPATIVGVFVYATSINRNRLTIIPQNEAPAICVPRVGSVKFLIRAGDDRAWTPDIPVKSVRCYVPCPAPGGAIEVKVTPDFGSNIIARPHYGRG